MLESKEILEPYVIMDVKLHTLNNEILKRMVDVIMTNENYMEETYHLEGNTLISDKFFHYIPYGIIPLAEYEKMKTLEGEGYSLVHIMPTFNKHYGFSVDNEGRDTGRVEIYYDINVKFEFHRNLRIKAERAMPF